MGWQALFQGAVGGVWPPLSCVRDQQQLLALRDMKHCKQRQRPMQQRFQQTNSQLFKKKIRQGKPWKRGKLESMQHSLRGCELINSGIYSLSRVGTRAIGEPITTMQCSRPLWQLEQQITVLR